MFSLWTIIVKILAMLDGFLQYFVTVAVQFNKADDGQWQVATFNAQITDKGSAVLADTASMVHYLFDFLAQIMSILPAKEGVTYNIPFG